MAFKLNLFFNYRRDKIIGQSSTFQWALAQWLSNLLGAAEFPSKAYLAWAGDNFGIAAGRFPAGMGWGRLSAPLSIPGLLVRPSTAVFRRRKATVQRHVGQQFGAAFEAESEIQFRRKADGSSFWDSLNDHDLAANDQAIKACHLGTRWNGRPYPGWASDSPR